MVKRSKKNKLKLYLSGPMRGYKNFNVSAFDKAAKKLRAEGWSVFNPADKDRERYGDKITESSTGNLADAEKLGFNLREVLAIDLEFLCKEADAIAMLPGWEKSLGASAEHAVARTLGLRIIYHD